MNANSVTDADDLRALPAFVFWSSWAAATDRPGATDLSYTSNWPHEPLIDNRPSTGAGIWSIASVILMIGAIAAMVMAHAAAKRKPIRSHPRRTRCST